MLIQIQILPFWFVQSRNVSTVLTITHRVMYRSKLCFIPTPPFPTKVRNWANLGPCQIQLIQSKVRNNNVTSPSPICPCCMSNEEKKKKTTFQTLSKESTVISSPSFWNWKNLVLSHFLVNISKKKKKKKEFGWWEVNLMSLLLSFPPSFISF